MSEFRHRGLKVEVDTTEHAEFDIADLGVSTADLSVIAANLASLPISDQDRTVDDIRIRQIAGFDVVFIVGREFGNIVATVGRIRLPDPSDPTEDILQKLGTIAIFRGATGL